MKSDILNHEKILSLIKELEQNPVLTQRELTRKTQGSGAIHRAYQTYVITRPDRVIQVYI